jgi:ribonuclease R
MSLLPDDYYDHDEARHCLTGRRWGRSYRLGEAVGVRLMEAAPITGGLILELVEEGVETIPDAARKTESGDWHPLDTDAPKSAGAERPAGASGPRESARSKPSPRRRRRAPKPRS